MYETTSLSGRYARDDVLAKKEKRNGMVGTKEYLNEQAKHRSLTHDESCRLDNLNQAIRDLSRDIGRQEKEEQADREAADTPRPPFGDERDMAAAHTGGDRELRYNRPLGQGRMADLVRSAGHVPAEHGGLSFDKFLRGATFGDWRDADAERRALQEGTASAGGVLVPTVLSARLIDLARNQAMTQRAGAQTIPMESARVDVAKWTGDPTASWHSESATIPTSEPTLGKVELRAKTLTVLVVASRELVEDTDIGSMLEQAFAARIGLEFDRVCLYGSGTDPEPLGVYNTSGVAKTEMNAAPSDYGYLIDARKRLAAFNEIDTGVIQAPREEATLAGLTGGDGHYLTPPQYVSSVTRYPTNQVRTDQDVDTNSDGTVDRSDGADSFSGNWQMLGMGVRTSIQVQPLRERYADTGEIGFLAWFRGDVAVLRTNAFDITTGILP